MESSTDGSSNDGIIVVVDLISADEDQMASKKKKKKGMQDEGGSKMKVTSQFGILKWYICELLYLWIDISMNCYICKLQNL
jgi:hypothetical protein